MTNFLPNFPDQNSNHELTLPKDVTLLKTYIYGPILNIFNPCTLSNRGQSAFSLTILSLLSVGFQLLSCHPSLPISPKSHLRALANEPIIIFLPIFTIQPI